MRLLLIIGLAVAAIWLVAAAFLLLAPYILGFIVLVFALGAAGRLFGWDKKAVDDRHTTDI